ncbi:formylglycine-generating enzyme family protein [Verrucomicrobiota bacterium]
MNARKRVSRAPNVLPENRPVKVRKFVIALTFLLISNIILLAGGDTRANGPCIVVDLKKGTADKVANLPHDLMTNDVYKTTKMVLKRVPAGYFTMGSPKSELGRDNYKEVEGQKTQETQHKVTFSKDFYIAVFECTEKQWVTVMGSYPSAYGDSRNPTSKDEKRAVRSVGWGVVRGGTGPNDAPDDGSFMGKLRKLTGKAFDLPTEAQWEYACRAGTTKAYNNNTDCLVSYDSEDTNLNALAWYVHNTDYESKKEPEEVGTKQANNWGLCDMHGNVWEWCLDTYVTDLGTQDRTDPVARSDSPDSVRVKRGGCGNSLASRCRSAYRSNPSPTTHETPEIGWGFRVVLWD